MIQNHHIRDKDIYDPLVNHRNVREAKLGWFNHTIFMGQVEDIKEEIRRGVRGQNVRSEIVKEDGSLKNRHD